MGLWPLVGLAPCRAGAALKSGVCLFRCPKSSHISAEYAFEADKIQSASLARAQAEGFDALAEAADDQAFELQAPNSKLVEMTTLHNGELALLQETPARFTRLCEAD